MLQERHRLEPNCSVRFEEYAYAEGFDEQTFKVLASIASRPIGERQAGIGFKAGCPALKSLGRALLPARVRRGREWWVRWTGTDLACWQALDTETGEGIKQYLNDILRLYTDLVAMKPVLEGQEEMKYNRLHLRELGDLTGPCTSASPR